jgi:hypothetical protein
MFHVEHRESGNSLIGHPPAYRPGHVRNTGQERIARGRRRSWPHAAAPPGRPPVTPGTRHDRGAGREPGQSAGRRSVGGQWGSAANRPDRCRRGHSGAVVPAGADRALGGSDARTRAAPCPGPRFGRGGGESRRTAMGGATLTPRELAPAPRDRGSSGSPESGAGAHGTGAATSRDVSNGSGYAFPAKNGSPGSAATSPVQAQDATSRQAGRTAPAVPVRGRADCGTRYGPPVRGGHGGGMSDRSVDQQVGSGPRAVARETPSVPVVEDSGRTTPLVPRGRSTGTGSPHLEPTGRGGGGLPPPQRCAGCFT